MNNPILPLSIVALSSFFAAFGALFLKKGSSNFSLSIKGILKNKKLILGLFFYAFSSVIFIGALRLGDLSLLYPVAALSYVWIAFLSVKYLGEKMTAAKWAGIFLIITGVTLISIGG